MCTYSAVTKKSLFRARCKQSEQKSEDRWPELKYCKGCVSIKVNKYGKARRAKLSLKKLGIVIFVVHVVDFYNLSLIHI